MIGTARVLALITARGGSKRLPGKNLRPLLGRPLVAWTVDAARGSEYVDRIVISSDAEDIIDAAVTAGAEAPFVRDGSLATDEADSVSVALDALARLDEDYDFLVLLQPTSPLRKAADIDACLEIGAHRETSTVVTVTASTDAPYSAFTMGNDGRLSRLLDSPHGGARHQDMPATYQVNGAVYVVRVPWFKRAKTFIDADTLGHPMPPEQSVDIDTLFDFQIAEMVLNARMTNAETGC